MEKRPHELSVKKDSEDEVDNVSAAAAAYPKPAPRRKLFASSSSIHNFPPRDEMSPCSSSGIDRIESSPDKDDSAYHTFHHHHHHHHSHHHGPNVSSISISKSSSIASSDRFPSEESLRSSSPYLSSKPVHSHLIRIQLGGDSRVSQHEWYSEFQNQSHNQRAFSNSPRLSSPLSNRSNLSGSDVEYDSHIAQKRGKISAVSRFFHYLFFAFLHFILHLSFSSFESIAFKFNFAEKSQSPACRETWEKLMKLHIFS